MALKEVYTRQEAIAGGISLGGTVLVAQPDALFGQHDHEGDRLSPEYRVVGAVLAVVCCVASSASYVVIRKIGKTAHALHAVEYYCMICTFVAMAIPFVVPGEDLVLPKRPIFWLYLTAIVSDLARQNPLNLF